MLFLCANQKKVPPLRKPASQAEALLDLVKEKVSRPPKQRHNSKSGYSTEWAERRLCFSPHSFLLQFINCTNICRLLCDVGSTIPILQMNKLRLREDEIGPNVASWIWVLASKGRYCPVSASAVLPAALGWPKSQLAVGCLRCSLGLFQSQKMAGGLLLLCPARQSLSAI